LAELSGWKFFSYLLNWSAGMSKVVRFPGSISAPSVSAEKAESKRSDLDLFVSVALFSAVGLLISIVAILLGLPGIWY
jgi:hypothetical protein